MPAQIAQRSCGVSIPGDIQNLSGHGPGQPALGAPALSKVLGIGDVQRCFPTSTILWLCDKQCGIIGDTVWPGVSLNHNFLKAFVHRNDRVSTYNTKFTMSIHNICGVFLA